MSYVVGGATRGMMMGIVVLIVSLFFTHLSLHSLPVVLLFLVLTSLMFATAGFANGMLARKFDDIALVPTFILTPLTYFGGVFYSITLLPPVWQKVSLANPILYMVNGLRYGFLGVSDIPVAAEVAILVVFQVGLFALNLHLMKRGVGLRS